MGENGSGKDGYASEDCGRSGSGRGGKEGVAADLSSGLQRRREGPASSTSERYDSVVTSIRGWSQEAGVWRAKGQQRIHW